MFEKIVPFVDHSNIDVRAHISYRGLHLKPRGSKLVAKSILNVPKSVRFSVVLHGYKLATKHKTISLTTSSKTAAHTINKQRLDYAKNIIIGHLNLNSLRSKGFAFKELILSKTNIFLLSETKIDESFPNPHFFAEGHLMIRRD